MDKLFAGYTLEELAKQFKNDELIRSLVSEICKLRTLVKIERRELSPFGIIPTSPRPEPSKPQRKAKS